MKVKCLKCEKQLDESNGHTYVMYEEMGTLCVDCHNNHQKKVAISKMRLVDYNESRYVYVKDSYKGKDIEFITNLNANIYFKNIKDKITFLSPKEIDDERKKNQETLLVERLMNNAYRILQSWKEYYDKMESWGA